MRERVDCWSTAYDWRRTEAALNAWPQFTTAIDGIDVHFIKDVRQPTVHHRDHNHDRDLPDGVNWELLCRYCHDNEHQRQLAAARGNADSGSGARPATHHPFASLKDLLSGPTKPA